MSINEKLKKIKDTLPRHVTLVAVSKTHPVEDIHQAYLAGQRIFGENKVQELVPKAQQLPKDIEWHLLGHLQSNKVKYIAEFVALIHSIDSLDLLIEVNRQAKKRGRVISCLLQLYIANEDTKFGLSYDECDSLIGSDKFKQLENIMVVGFMGMATNTSDKEVIGREFKSLKNYFDLKSNDTSSNFNLNILSMGMSSDYETAIAEGSTMIRLGSSIFGTRNYNV